MSHPAPMRQPLSIVRILITRFDSRHPRFRSIVVVRSLRKRKVVSSILTGSIFFGLKILVRFCPSSFLFLSHFDFFSGQCSALLQRAEDENCLEHINKH